LRAAGANLERIIALTGIECAGHQRIPDLSDTAAIREAIERCHAKLVVIDPLMAFLPGATDSHRDQDVRRVLAPLARLAEETGVAVLVIRHLNKLRGGRALYRGGGSIGIVGAARCALLVAQHPDDPARRVLAPTKANLAAVSPSLAFHIQADAAGSSFIEWLGPAPFDAEQLVAAADAATDPEARTAVAEARSFLRDFLAAGPRSAPDCNREARNAGISERTLARAKCGLVRGQKSSFRGGWEWALIEERHEGRQGCQPATLGSLRPDWQPSAIPAGDSALSRLRGQGIRPWIGDDGHLWTDPAPERLSDEAFELVRQHEHDIRRELMREGTS
jgi:hypothetical protein